MEKEQRTTAQSEKIRTELERELTFQNGIHSALVTTILDKIIVKKGSTKEVLRFDIHLKSGGPWGGVFDRKNSSFRFTPCLRAEAKGKPLWKANGQRTFQRGGREMVCHYMAIWNGQ